MNPSYRCNGCWKFHAYSLIPPIISAFFKYDGTYVGGSAGGQGNYYGDCYTKPWLM